MTIENFTFIAASVISIVSIVYVKRQDIRKAVLCLFVFQSATWLVSNVLVDSGKIIFPTRILIKSTRVDFLPQFLFYPVAFMWFILLYPSNRSALFKFLHYIIFISIPVWFIYFEVNYTDLRRPGDESVFLQFLMNYLSFFIQFRLCHIYIRWFLKEKHKAENG